MLIACACLLFSIMELVPEPHKASESVPKDFISTMPDNVMTYILDRLRIEDAVKTGILSPDCRCPNAVRALGDLEGAKASFGVVEEIVTEENVVLAV
ncbi:hypothetical protein Tco_0348326 [Tanacetum coccineum]